MPLAEIPAADLLALNRQVLVARIFPGTAHDVNNALQIIGGSTDLLGQQPTGEALQRAVQRVRAQTDRAAETLRLLLDFAHGRDEGEGRLSLARVVKLALTLRAHALRRAGVTVVFEADNADVAVHGVRGELLQLVLNLMLNAEQAVQGRKGETIVVELVASGAQATLRIIDRGSGIPQEVAGQLFTPFVSSHPVSGSLGLGLAAARLIAQRHGGDVTLESSESGTCATLSLPLAVAGRS